MTLSATENCCTDQKKKIHVFFFNIDNMLEILHFEVRNALESTAKLLTEQIKELLF